MTARRAGLLPTIEREPRRLEISRWKSSFTRRMRSSSIALVTAMRTASDRSGFPWLRPLRPQDVAQAEEVYRDAVLSQADRLYSPAQVRAWADHPRSSEALRQAIAQVFTKQKATGSKSASG